MSAPAGCRAVRRSFVRSMAEIDAIVEFTADAFVRLAIDASLRVAVDVVIEELFTNMVKYGGKSTAMIEIGFEAIETGIEVQLIDRDVEAFDVAKARPVTTDAPLETREPGGLGLHLIHRMVDEIAYQYIAESRESRISFRKTAATHGGSPHPP